MEEKKPHKTIKQLLDEAGLQPTEGDWDKMQAMLDKQLPTKAGGKSNPFTSWQSWLIATGIVITGMVGYLLVKNSSNAHRNAVATTHPTEQVQNIDDANAPSDTSSSAIKQQNNTLHREEEKSTTPLHDSLKANNTTHDGTTSSASKSPALNSKNLANHQSRQAEKGISPGTKKSNRNNADGDSLTESEQADPTQVNQQNATTNKQHRTDKKGKRLVEDSNGSINNQQQPVNNKKTKTSPGNRIVDDLNNDSRQEVNEKGNKEKLSFTDTDTTSRSIATKNDGVDKPVADTAKQVMSKQKNLMQDKDTSASASATYKTKNTAKKKERNKSANGLASANTGFALGVQLSPVQINFGEGKTAEANFIPALHARYVFSRVGVGITLFPFINNSTGKNKLYAHADTTLSTDTLNGRNIITLNEYYTKRVTSYKGAVNLSYQLSNNLLLEGGVGLQHLTAVQTERKQTIRRDTALVTITTNTVHLKSSDSIFRQTTQNTGFLFFNVWYTAGPWQFGAGYTQNGKSWFKSTDSQKASQLQLNIRYLFDFRKNK